MKKKKNLILAFTWSAIYSWQLKIFYSKSLGKQKLK